MKKHAPNVEDLVDLHIGETDYKTKCPKCGVGGGSFSVTRIREGLLYNCFRNSCGNKGFVPLLVSFIPQKEKPIKESRLPVMELRNLNEDEQNFFIKKFEFNPIYEFKWCSNLDGVFIPIQFNDVNIGYCIRKYKELCKEPTFGSGQKVLYYKINTSLPNCHYINIPKSQHVIIVEDVISCIKISKLGYSSIALLGTHFKEELLPYLKNKKIVLWLDNDALAKAVAIGNKYKLFVKDLRVKYTIKDPKDIEMTDLIDELRE